MARRWARYGLLLAALAAGLAVGLSFGSNAYAGTVCSTTGDVSFCAQWGVMGFATRLQVKNTGSQTISSFTFALPSSATVTGAAGNTGCHAAQPAANDVTCSTPTASGQQQFVDILSSPTPAVGSSGTITLSDSGGTPQPSQNLTLDSSAVCVLAAQTGTTACTTTSTTPTHTQCHCTRLSVALGSFKEVDHRLGLVFYLDWSLDCTLGDTSGCYGTVSDFGKLKEEAEDHHLRLIWRPQKTNDSETHRFPHGEFHMNCGTLSQKHSDGCNRDHYSGRARFELFGPLSARENVTLAWEMRIECFDLQTKARNETLRMKFDRYGNLALKESQLGTL